MDTTVTTLCIFGIFALCFSIAYLVGSFINSLKKLTVFQGKVVAKQKMNRDGLIMPVSEVPTYKEDDIRYHLTVEYLYSSGKKVESGRTGEINEVEISKTVKQSSFTCRHEVQFANYQIGQTYWFVGEDKKGSYVVVV